MIRIRLPTDNPVTRCCQKDGLHTSRERRAYGRGHKLTSQAIAERPILSGAEIPRSNLRIPSAFGGLSDRARNERKAKKSSLSRPHTIRMMSPFPRSCLLNTVHPTHVAPRACHMPMLLHSLAGERREINCFNGRMIKMKRYLG